MAGKRWKASCQYSIPCSCGYSNPGKTRQRRLRCNPCLGCCQRSRGLSWREVTLQCRSKGCADKGTYSMLRMDTYVEIHVRISPSGTPSICSISLSLSLSVLRLFCLSRRQAKGVVLLTFTSRHAQLCLHPQYLHAHHVRVLSYLKCVEVEGNAVVELASLNIEAAA